MAGVKKTIANLVGPKGEKGDTGAPGSNTVPTTQAVVAAVPQALATPESKAALNATTAETIADPTSAARSALNAAYDERALVPGAMNISTLEAI